MKLDKIAGNEIVRGMFIGIFIVSVFIPFFLVFGANKFTTLLLFYLAPITGAFTSYFIENKKFMDFVKGTKILVKSDKGIYKGVVENIENEKIRIGKSSRIDTLSVENTGAVEMDKKEINEISLNDISLEKFFS